MVAAMVKTMKRHGFYVVLMLVPDTISFLMKKMDMYSRKRAYGSHT